MGKLEQSYLERINEPYADELATAADILSYGTNQLKNE